MLSDTIIYPPARRTDKTGRIGETIKFAHVRLEWKDESFVMVHSQWREGFGMYFYTAILHPGGPDAEGLIKAFLLAVKAYERELKDEILVFNDG